MQRICRENDVLFILDEVITGFRLGLGGAQQFYGLSPDLSTFAKAMANGAPIGAFAGRREVMSSLEGGRVRHAGTYNATPLGLAAAHATLRELAAGDGAVYAHLDRLGRLVMAGLQEAIDRSGIPGIVQGQGSMFQVYFTDMEHVGTYRDAMRTDRDLFSRFAHEMIYRGVFVHPDVFEHWFLSAAHTEADVATIVETAEDALQAIARGQSAR
jgi:glutamate-1-semialdehyde 2,1-aminomutase